jgi:hypothetical protein
MHTNQTLRQAESIVVLVNKKTQANHAWDSAALELEYQVIVSRCSSSGMIISEQECSWDHTIITASAVTLHLDYVVTRFR